MNNRAKVNAKVAPAKINMYCKVCADAGKPREVISSHNVRDATGANTCPTLAEQQCKYCKKPGHTVKFCKELEEKNKIRSKNLSQCEKQIVSTQSVLKPPTTPVAAKNGFAALYSDSESGEDTDDAEHDTKCCVKENAEDRNFPPLKGWKNVTSLLPFATGITLNFAAVLQTPATKKTKPVNAPPAPVKAAAPVKAREIQSIVLKGKWADEGSSDEEDDDDDEEIKTPIQTPVKVPVQVQTTCAW